MDGTLLDAWASMKSFRPKDGEDEARPFWKPVHLQPPYRQAPTAGLHRTDALWSRIPALPCSTNLGTDEQDHVIAATKTALRPNPTPSHP